MNDPQDLIEKLAGGLADDLRIDWADLRSQDLDQAETLNNLQILAQIAQLQGQASTEPGTETEEGLFKWGGLIVHELIGSGAFGEVYRAHEPILDRTVALKLLKPQSVMALQSLQFIEEARRMARVRHPNVLAIHGADVHTGRQGFWADLIQGKTLKQLSQSGPMAAEQLFDVLKDLSQGLGAIHQAGVIHGDVKPANVMQDEHDSFLLMDFGAGDRFKEKNDTVHAWQGTPLLMAPELINQQQAGPKADIYALGASLYQVASGSYPVTGETLAEVVSAHANQTKLPLRKRRPDLPQAWCALIDQMLHDNPTQRPDAEQILEALQVIKALPEKRRKRLAVLSVVSALVLGLGFTSWGFYQASQERNQAVQAERHTQAINDFLTDMLNARSQLGRGKDMLVSEVLAYASQKIDATFSDQPLVAASLHEAVANSYDTIDDLDRAQHHLERSFALKRPLLEEYAEPMLSTHISQIQLSQSKEDHAGTLALIEPYLAAVEPVWGVDHDYVRLARIRQVETLMAMGRYPESLDVLESHLSEVPEAAVAENSHGYMILKARALTYLGLGQFQKAKETIKAAINWQHQNPRKVQINELNSRSILALVHLEMDDPLPAVEIFESIRADKEVMFGKVNRSYIKTLNNLGTAYKALPDIQNSLRVTEEAFALSEELYGTEIKDDVLSIRGNLANLYVESGDVEKGTALLRENLSMARDQLGPKHLTTLIFEYNLAEQMHKQGHHQHAIDMASQTYVKMGETLGPEHVYTKLNLDNWAVGLAGLGQHELALEKHREAVTAVQSALGDEHILTWLVISHYVDTLMLVDDVVLAEQWLRQLVTTQADKLPADDPQLLKNQERLNQLTAL